MPPEPPLQHARTRAQTRDGVVGDEQGGIALLGHEDPEITDGHIGRPRGPRRRRPVRAVGRHRSCRCRTRAVAGSAAAAAVITAAGGSGRTRPCRRSRLRQPRHSPYRARAITAQRQQHQQDPQRPVGDRGLLAELLGAHHCSGSVQHRRAAPQQRGGDAAGQRHAAIRRVARRAGEVGTGRPSSAVGVDDGQVGGLTRGRWGGRAQPSRPIRAGATDMRSATPAQSRSPRSDHGVDHDGQRRGQSEHAERRGVPFAVLVLGRVRGVVGRHDVDGPVGQSLAQRHTSRSGAQRRIDLEEGVVAADQFVGEQQMVRCHLGGDVDAALLGAPDQVDAAGGGDVAHVQPRADVVGQQDVAGDDRLLRGGGPAPQPQHGRHRALVHLRAGGEPRLLRVLGDDPVERLDVLQCPAHEQRVVDTFAVVAEHPHAGGRIGHGAEFGQLLPAQADGDGPDREDVDVAGLLAQSVDLLDDTGGVGHRVGVGHGMDGR